MTFASYTWCVFCELWFFSSSNPEEIIRTRICYIIIFNSKPESKSESQEKLNPDPTLNKVNECQQNFDYIVLDVLALKSTMDQRFIKFWTQLDPLPWFIVIYTYPLKSKHLFKLLILFTILHESIYPLTYHPWTHLLLIHPPVIPLCFLKHME